MKISKIECPSCGCSIRPEKMDSICECPACKSTFYVDDEKQIVNININNYGSSYNPRTAGEGNIGKGSPISAVAIIAFLVAVAFILPHMFMSIKDENNFIYEYRKTPVSEPFVLFAEQLHDKTVYEVDADEYAKLKYIYVYRDCPENASYSDLEKYPWRFDYAYSVDDEGSPVDMESIWVESSAEAAYRDLQVFTGVVNAGFGKGSYTWDGDYGEKHNYGNLKELRYYKADESMYYIAEAFADPGKIERLDIGRFDSIDDEVYENDFTGLKSLTLDMVGEDTQLDNIAKLSSLEELNINYFSNEQSNDMAFLSSLHNLKTLRLNFATDTDMSGMEVFYGMPSIEVLELANIKAVKNIDFVKNMPKLESLSISYCSIISIEPLRGSTRLTQLHLSDMYNTLTDVSALESITNLKALTLSSVNVYRENMPSLSNLTNLKDVVMDLEYVDSISGLTGIENLECIGAYNASAGSVIAGLVGLKKLSLDGNENDTQIMPAISALPSLTELNMKIALTHECDISPIFNSESITDMSIISYGDSHNDVQLDVYNMQDNHVLKKLVMEDIDVYDIGRDDMGGQELGVYADDILKHFPAMEELYVASNKIESLDFATHMPELRVLDIADNYVSDITPLLSCEKLSVLSSEGNPISNRNILPEGVQEREIVK